MAVSKILYFQHRRTNQCQALESGSKIAKLLVKAKKSWGQIPDKATYEKALGGSKEVPGRYVPAAK